MSRYKGDDRRLATETLMAAGASAVVTLALRYVGGFEWTWSILAFIAGFCCWMVWLLVCHLTDDRR